MKAALVVSLLLWVPGPARAAADGPPQAVGPSAPDPIERAIHAMYNVDFAEAHRVVDAHLAANPSDPLGHAARAGALLFAEYHRLKVLEINFFESDDSLTDKQRLKPDPAVRARIFDAVAEVRRLAKAKLSADPNDRRTLFAMLMGVGVETQYTAIVEKRYVRGGTLSKETQTTAERMIKLNPPAYDAYLTLGSIEYAVSNLNPFYRMLARFRGLRSGKDKAQEHLQIVVNKGHYYRTYAKILLSVLHIRERRLPAARALLEELRREFPANPLFPRELARIEERISKGARD